MAEFTFKLDYFTIDETMSKHKDTDWVYFTVKVGDKVLGPIHGLIGDLNNGHYDLNWILGPIEAAANDTVVMTYQIVNHGHGDTDEQIADDVEIATAIAAGTLAIVSGGSIAALEVIAGALGAASGVTKWIFGSEANCDGMVLSDALTITGSELLDLTQPGGVHSEVRAYTGPETPHGCGPDAKYHVAWTVFYTKTPLKPGHIGSHSKAATTHPTR